MIQTCTKLHKGDGVESISIFFTRKVPSHNPMSTTVI